MLLVVAWQLRARGSAGRGRPRDPSCRGRAELDHVDGRRLSLIAEVHVRRLGSQKLAVSSHLKEM